MSDNASDLVEKAQALVQSIPEAAIAECREMLADRIMKMGADEIMSCMKYPPPGFEVTAEFLDGLRFAAELVRDKEFDY